MGFHSFGVIRRADHIHIFIAVSDHRYRAVCGNHDDNRVGVAGREPQGGVVSGSPGPVFIADRWSVEQAGEAVEFAIATNLQSAVDPFQISGQIEQVGTLEIQRLV